MRKPRPIHLKNRHVFQFALPNGKVLKAPAKVVRAKTSPELELTEAHLLQAIAAKGHGNPQACAMAVCSRAHSHVFPHAFHFVDWLYSRAYFVTKVHPETGLPTECVVYTHHDNVAPLFDTLRGMKKLLKEIREKGPRTIKLYPPTIQNHVSASGRTAAQSHLTARKAYDVARKKSYAARMHAAMLGMSPQAAA